MKAKAISMAALLTGLGLMSSNASANSTTAECIPWPGGGQICKVFACDIQIDIVPVNNNNPNTGLTYIPTIEMPGVFKDTGMDIAKWQSPHFQIDPGVEFGTDDTPADYSGAFLVAWDAVKQKKVWQHKLPPNWNPGTMTTKGNLVMQGRADGEFVAYDATSGEQLWSKNLGLGISSAPITYAVDGKQYVSLLVGWGGGGLIAGTLAAQHGWKYKVHPRRLFTFTLDGKQPVPASPPPAFAQPLDPADFKVDIAKVAHGKTLYSHACVLCHGGGVVSGGLAPDLRESPLATSHAALKGVVVEGALLVNGMPRFRDLNDADIEGLLHYIRQQARAAVTSAHN